MGQAGCLATIISQDEQDFVQSILPAPVNNYQAWLGAQVTSWGNGAPSSYTWAWVTGELWSYTHWELTQPEPSGWEPYLAMFWEPSWKLGYWNDEDFPLAYSIVEYDGTFVPEPTTLAGAGMVLAMLAVRRTNRRQAMTAQIHKHKQEGMSP